MGAQAVSIDQIPIHGMPDSEYAASLSTMTIGFLQQYSEGFRVIKKRIDNQGAFSPSVVIPFKLTSGLTAGSSDTITFRFHDYTKIKGLDIFQADFEQIKSTWTLNDWSNIRVNNGLSVKIIINDTCVLPAGGWIESGGGGVDDNVPVDYVSAWAPSWCLAVVGPKDIVKVTFTKRSNTDDLIGINIGVLLGEDLNARNLL